MKLRTVVIIATKGRPQEVSHLLDALVSQTVPPDRIVLSACDPEDIARSCGSSANVTMILGSPGLPAQRNRALSAFRDDYDIVVFFDDDFVPSRYWIENVQDLMKANRDIACITGHVLADGAATGGLDWSKGWEIVCKADLSKPRANMKASTIKDHYSPYGCNMAFRSQCIQHIVFDERLALYAWLEDRDFAFRMRGKGRMIWTDFVWGVHLGVQGVRVSGIRLGYSQVVNPWYLMKKGSMLPGEAYINILRATARNALGSFFRDPHIDRWGRFKGNIVGIKDIVKGQWAPEKICQL